MRTPALIPGILLIAFLAAAPVAAHSNYTGRTLKSGTQGCGNCHATQNSSVSVTISGPASLAPGQEGTYEVRISGGGGSTVCVDIATSAGTLKPRDGNTRTSNGELITNGTKKYSSGAYTYSFILTAPSTAQTVTLYATGMSTMSTFNFAQNFAVTVQAATDADAVPVPAHSVAHAISESWPNPFTESTGIGYSVTGRATVHLAVYDAAGNELAVFVEGEVEPGYNSVRWNAGARPSGIYFWRMIVTGPDGVTHSSTRKILLTR
jgi:hypothetical protein